MPVQAGLVKEVLVERILEAALAREPARPAPLVKRALDARLDIQAADGGLADLRMRGLGYLTRGVEAELFEPAREAWHELAGRLSRRLTEGEDWREAATAVSLELARREPLSKPAPDDEDAVSWKVPGPGGHVRHFVVAAAIAEVLSGADAEGGTLRQAITNPSELKRCWIYGFLIRCCEEALAPPPEAGV
jgi:hypothetical protein